MSKPAAATFGVHELGQSWIPDVIPLDTLHRVSPGKIDDDDDDYVLNKDRQTTLARIDDAEFSRHHIKVCMVAGVGFFTDAYDIFAINIAATMLGYVYGTNGTLDPKQDLGLKVATPVGTLIGQLLFGWLADVVGRKRMYGIELMFIIVTTFAQALAGQGYENHAVHIVGALIVWRFIMGIGIGGDCPLSAVIASEFASKYTRGRMMTAVFANQGWGQLTASLVALIVVSAYSNALQHAGILGSIDVMWRLIIGFGCVPGAIALYFRLTIPETPRFTMDIERNVQQAARDVEDYINTGGYVVDPDAAINRANAPRASRNDFLAYFSRRENLMLLVGTAYSWFALDFAFYGLGLNQSTILENIDFGNSAVNGTDWTSILENIRFGNTSVNGTGSTNHDAVYESLRGIAVGNVIVAVAGLIPGYWATFFLIDRWGRKPIQLMGFIMLTILFLIMGSAYKTLIPGLTEPGPATSGTKVFFFLYCLANFFENFGPNTTTFIVPGELFPTRYRSTAHGISAASGKLGAIIAQVAFNKLLTDQPQYFGYLLLALAGVMLTGVASTLLIKETKQQSLEELSNERQEKFIGGFGADHSRK